MLRGIVEKVKDNITFLLSEMRELLPYEYQAGEEPADYCKGVWTKVSEDEWKDGLYSANLYSIDTRDSFLNIFTKSVWFKRNFLTLHDAVTDTH